MPDTTDAPSPLIGRLPFDPLALLARWWLLVLVVVLVLISAATWFLGAFNDQGYAPKQPVPFNHELHAGQLQMDCRYCHFNAEKGKHAGLPPMQTCLGCHQDGQVGQDKPGVAKLLKIAAEGSYTENGVTYEGGVVHWNRVHKLPDHVYFNHQAHAAAGVACMTCHGPVTAMPVMRQYAKLSMQWCLDCHRNTNYVSDPKRANPETGHHVGVASYPVVIEGRQVPEAPVHVPARQVAGGPADQGGVAPAAHAAHPKVSPAAAWQERLKKLVAANPELPRWKVADLPASHRAWIEESQRLTPEQVAKLPVEELLKTYHNAPTQCSTCHQ